jgi:hypothetical protein
MYILRPVYFTTYLDDFLEEVVLLFPAVQSHILCLVIVTHSGHALLTNRTVVSLTDVLVTHDPVKQFMYI